MTLGGVSRETAERLDIYSALLAKWNARINLVSRASLADHRARHFADSAQIHRVASHPVGHWADLGSGGGFPGLIVAILACETGFPAEVTLVEADARKSAFLSTVIRETGVHARVLTERIESIAPLGADVVSARALADLATLLGYAARHLAPGGEALFAKGARWEAEIAQARRAWQFDCAVVKSETEPGSVILKVRGMSRV